MWGLLPLSACAGAQKLGREEEIDKQGTPWVCSRTSCIPQWTDSTDELIRNQSKDSLADLGKALEQEWGSLEGAFERRGLRAWDVLWNASFAELQGRVLTVYDVNEMEGDRTLLAHAVLDDTFEVERVSDTEWRLRAPKESPLANDFTFQWRTPDAWCAARWVEQLEDACRPERVAGVEKPPEAMTWLDIWQSEAMSLLVPALLSPAMGGPWALGTIIADLLELGAEAGKAAQTGDELDPEDENYDPHPLVTNASGLSRCLVDNRDVQLRAFVLAIRDFSTVVALMGDWAKPMVNEVSRHVDIIDKCHQAAGERGNTMRSLLEHEVEQGMHKEGAILADPSGAMSLLWGARTLRLWAGSFEAVVKANAEGKLKEPGMFGRAFDAGYAASIQPYSGYLVLGIYSFARRFIAEWPVVSARLAPSEEEVIRDVKQWLMVVNDVVDRLDFNQQDLDLDDQRKTY